MSPISTASLIFMLSVFRAFAPAADAQDYPPSWKLAHPDAKALAGVNVRSLSESQVVQKLASQFETSPLAMLPWKEMGVLKEIDQIFLSSPGAKTPDTKQNPPVLIVVSGRFTTLSVRQLSQGTHRIYHSVEIYELPGGKSLNIAQLNASTLLLGDEASLHGAIDRSGGRAGGTTTLGAKPPVAMLERAASLAASHDFWVIAAISPAALQPANLSLGKMAADIRGFDAGFSLRDGFALDVSVTTATPEIAHDMMQRFSSALQMAAASKLSNQDGAELLKKFEVASDGARVGVKIALTPEEVDRAIRTAQANRQKMAPQSPALIDQPQTIRIYGLDDGVREIPMGPR